MEQTSQQVVHGALDYGELEQLGLSPEEILDFSVNTNPYGPSPLVRPALAHAAIDRYPDRECLELRRALLAYELRDAPVALDSILCGNGTAELIWAIARAWLPVGSKAAIVGPTFGEYAVASRASGARVVEYRAVGADRRPYGPSTSFSLGDHRTDPQGRGQAHAPTDSLIPFHLDLAEMVAWLQAEQPTLLWLCNPNNPTGIWLNQWAMSQIADACARFGTVLVVDEAYWHFLTPREAFSAVALLDRQGTSLPFGSRYLEEDEGSSVGAEGGGKPRRSEVPAPLSPLTSFSLGDHPAHPRGRGQAHAPTDARIPTPERANPFSSTAPLIVLRSLTKTYALAGLRLGYAVASAPVIAQIRQQLPSWNVNSCAQAAGVAALADRAHCTRTLAELAVQRHDFFHALSFLDIPVLPSRTHFCLIDVGDAQRVRQQLLHRRLLVRDCTSFGLPTCIRVATRQRDDWQQLLSALQEVVCH